MIAAEKSRGHSIGQLSLALSDGALVFGALLATQA